MSSRSFDFDLRVWRERRGEGRTYEAEDEVALTIGLMAYFWILNVEVGGIEGWLNLRPRGDVQVEHSMGCQVSDCIETE